GRRGATAEIEASSASAGEAARESTELDITARERTALGSGAAETDATSAAGCTSAAGGRAAPAGREAAESEDTTTGCGGEYVGCCGVVTSPKIWLGGSPRSVAAAGSPRSVASGGSPRIVALRSSASKSGPGAASSPLTARG